VKLPFALPVALFISAALLHVTRRFEPVTANDSLRRTKSPNTRSRISAGQVVYVMDRLGDRDQAIISTLGRVRVASARQLERIHFTDSTPLSNARSCRATLARLTRWRVLARLERRVGGVRSGSAGYVYSLDVAEARPGIDFAEVEGIITEALEIAVDCQQAYRRAPEELRQKLNQFFFKRLEIDNRWDRPHGADRRDKRPHRRGDRAEVPTEESGAGRRSRRLIAERQRQGPGTPFFRYSSGLCGWAEDQIGLLTWTNELRGVARYLDTLSRGAGMQGS